MSFRLEKIDNLQRNELVDQISAGWRCLQAAGLSSPKVGQKLRKKEGVDDAAAIDWPPAL